MDDAYNIINNDHDAREYNRHFYTQTPGLVNIGTRNASQWNVVVVDC